VPAVAVFSAKTVLVKNPTAGPHPSHRRKRLVGSGYKRARRLRPVAPELPCGTAVTRPWPSPKGPPLTLRSGCFRSYRWPSLAGTSPEPLWPSPGRRAVSCPSPRSPDGWYRSMTAVVMFAGPAPDAGLVPLHRTAGMPASELPTTPSSRCLLLGAWYRGYELCREIPPGVSFFLAQRAGRASYLVPPDKIAGFRERGLTRGERALPCRPSAFHLRQRGSLRLAPGPEPATAGPPG